MSFFLDLDMLIKKKHGTALVEDDGRISFCFTVATLPPQYFVHALLDAWGDPLAGIFHSRKITAEICTADLYVDAQTDLLKVAVCGSAYFLKAET